MNSRSKQTTRTEVAGLIAVGLLLLAIVALVDPVGSSADTGVLDLGSNGTQWALGVFGVFFVAAGFVTIFRTRRSS